MSSLTSDNNDKKHVNKTMSSLTDDDNNNNHNHLILLDPKGKKKKKFQSICNITSITSSMLLLQPELIPKEYKQTHGITQRSFTGGTKNLWLQIYAYLQPSCFTRLRMKCSCRLFNDVEKMITSNPNCSPLKPIPLYTSLEFASEGEKRVLL